MIKLSELTKTILTGLFLVGVGCVFWVAATAVVNILFLSGGGY